MIGWMFTMLLQTPLPKTDYKQLEIELKHELKDNTNQVIYIKDTNIKLIKRKDGSAILRIIDGKI